MFGGRSVAFQRDLQTLFETGTVAGLSDRELIEKFLHARDGSSESAFEAIVRRHGPMVLRVCRGALMDWNDAEDAFQATFVILARRAAAIQRRDSLESWLHGVARRVSARARVEAARRRVVERQGARDVDAAPIGHDGEARFPDLGPLVHEEVRRLPEKYRSALLLCYWDGLTHEQAAEQLGCPLGTVRSRIARGRDLLQRRLTRRGVGPVAGAAVPGLSIAPTIPAVVPDAWITATVRAIARSAPVDGPIAAASVSATVSTLVRHVSREMMLMKLKTTALCFSILGFTAAGAILAAPQSRKDRTPTAPPPSKAENPKATSAKTAGPARGTKKEPTLHTLATYVVEPPDMLLVEVLEALPGRPITGERLVRPDGTISLGFYGEIPVAGLTIPQIKERIVLHLRKYINDDILGLIQNDPKTGDIKRDPSGKVVIVDPRESDRVFVDVTNYNSKNYYVEGAVEMPSRLPVTGHDTVRDAIHYCNGLSAAADHSTVVLYRKDKDGALQRLSVDIDQVLMGDDPTTNYQLQPGDRLVVPFRRGAAPDEGSAEEPTAARPAAPRVRPHDAPTAKPSDGAQERQRLRDVERRLGDVERKLDRILEALEHRDNK